MSPLLKETVNPLGDVADETGFSPYPGNINVLLVSLKPVIYKNKKIKIKINLCFMIVISKYSYSNSCILLYYINYVLNN